MLINTGNISRKVLSKVLRSFDKTFERLHCCSQIADASIEIEKIIKDLSEAELKDEKVLKVVLKKCIESKSDIKSMADGKSLDMLTDKIMELVKDVYL